MQVVILAGGKGKRLAPFTTVFPKPLLPIDDVPILEVIIRQLRNVGFTELTMAVGHLAGLLEAYFGDGSKWGVNIKYSLEDEPLGTAGPLGLIQGLSDPFMVLNGDVLTSLDFADLVEYHKRHKAIATVAVCNKKIEISLGALKVDEKSNIYDYIEKPTLEYQASMGIYVFEPRVLEYIEERRYLDLPDLIRMLIEDNEIVKGYEFQGYWRDIGRREDYEKAVEEFVELKDELLA